MLRRNGRAIGWISLLAALAVFFVVQDRITAAGARRYVALQHQAVSGNGPRVTIDGVMRPAIEHGVRTGLLWGGVTLASGLLLAVWTSR